MSSILLHLILDINIESFEVHTAKNISAEY